MSLKAAILEEVQVGQTVVLSYGLQTVSGRVLRLSENMIHIQTAESSPRIDLESITSFDVLPDGAVPPSAQVLPRVQMVPAPAQAVPAPAAPAPVGRAMADLRAELPAETPALAPEEGLALLRAALHGADAAQVPAGEINGILDSLANAMRNHALDSKLHDLKAHTNRLYQEAEGEPALDLLTLLMAELELCGAHYDAAAACFAAVGRHEAAASCARQAGLPDSAAQYLLQAVLNGETLTPAGAKLLGAECVRLQNAAVLPRALSLKPAAEAVHGLLLCAAVVAGHLGIELSGEVFAAPADLLGGFCRLLPAAWQADSGAVRAAEEALAFAQKERAAALRPVPAAPAGPAVSTVQKFVAEKGYGFLFAKPLNLYFYITQVDNRDPLLRWALGNGQYTGIEVRYELTQGQRGAMAASVELTDAGRAALQKRTRPLSRSDLQPGRLLFYRKDQDWGRIEAADGTTYSYKSNALDDPWLEAYCRKVPEVEPQDILFSLEEMPTGKPVARHAMLREPLPEATVALLGLESSAAAMEHWKNFCALLDAPAPEITDPFADRPYEPLPVPEKPAQAARRRPLSAAVKPPAAVRGPAAAAAAASAAAAPQRAAVPAAPARA